MQVTWEGQRHDDPCKQTIERAHERQELALPHPVADNAEHRAKQRPHMLHRRINRQHEHRLRLDQHVPAQDQRLHFEGAGGAEVCWPLKPETADLEGRQRGARWGGAHTIIPGR